jgi:hypothetical protein
MLTKLTFLNVSNTPGKVLEVYRGSWPISIWDVALLSQNYQTLGLSQIYNCWYITLLIYNCW